MHLTKDIYKAVEKSLLQYTYTSTETDMELTLTISNS